MFQEVIGIDFETTELEPSRGWPWQCGLTHQVCLDGVWNEVEGVEVVLGIPRHYKTGKPTRSCNLFSLEVCGLSEAWKQIKAAPPIQEGAEQIARFLASRRGLPLVAFNSPFDSSQLSELAFLAGGWGKAPGEFVPRAFPISGVWVDVLAMARQKWAGESNKLDDVLGRLGLSRSTERHGALEDARLAVQVMSRLSGVCPALQEALL